MRSLILSLVIMASSGCAISEVRLPSLNSETTKNSSTTDMQKTCGCAGCESCSTMTNCGTCCTPQSCACKQITSR
jgi:hypothetical protein